MFSFGSRYVLTLWLKCVLSCLLNTGNSEFMAYSRNGLLDIKQGVLANNIPFDKKHLRIEAPGLNTREICLCLSQTCVLDSYILLCH